MTATVNGFVLRGEFHVARQIGHMDLQVVTRRDVVLVQGSIQKNARPFNGLNPDGFIPLTIWARPSDDQLITHGPTGRLCIQDNLLIPPLRINRCGDSRGFRRAVNPSGPVKDGATPHQHRVILNTQRSQIGEDDLSTHIRWNRLLRRADLQSTSWRRDQRVDSQFRIAICCKPQLTIHPKPLQRRRQFAIEREHPSGMRPDYPHQVCAPLPMDGEDQSPEEAAT